MADTSAALQSAAQPTAAPLGEGFERPFGVPKVEGRGDQTAHRQQIGDGEKGECGPACDAGKSEAQKEQQAKAKAGKDFADCLEEARAKTEARFEAETRRLQGEQTP